jgi:hypothetical protein
MIGSKGFSHGDKLGGDECAAALQKDLENHGISAVCGKNEKLYPQLDPCTSNPQLQKQIVASVSTDNCSTALSTAHKFISTTRAAVAVTHGPKISDKLELKTARCLSHALDLLCSKGESVRLISLHRAGPFGALTRIVILHVDVLEFAPSAKELFEHASSIASGNSRARRDHLEKEFGGKVRRMLDSDGARWGDRLKVAVALADDDLWSRLLQWSRAELTAATAAREGTAHLKRIVELLGSAACRFEVKLLVCLFSDILPIIKASQSSFLGSVTFQQFQTITALRSRYDLCEGTRNRIAFHAFLVGASGGCSLRRSPLALTSVADSLH